MASVEIEKLSEHLLKCPVCLETFREPKVLPCLHTFCQKCLQGMLKHEECVIVCPTCRSETPLPKDGVSSLSSNFFINNMLDFISVQTSCTNPVYCTNCEDKTPAVARCLDCVEFMCDMCVNAHRRTRLTKDHDVLELQVLKAAPEVHQDKLHRPLLCSLHEREVLKYFCDTCDEPVCRECLIMEHREHTYGYLKDVNKKHRTEVGVLLNSSKKKLGPLKEAINNLKELMGRLDNRAEELRTDIRRNCKECVETIEERQEHLLTELNGIYNMKLKTLEIQLDGLGLTLGNLNSSIDFTENVLKHGNEAEIMLVKKQMKQRLEELNAKEVEYDPDEDDVIKYDFYVDIFKTAVEELGRLKIHSTFPAYCIASGIGIYKAKVGIEAVFIITTRDRYKENCTEGGDEPVVTIAPPEGEQYPGTVIDNCDGTFTVTYTPGIRGNHDVTISIRGRQIQDSPFSVQVVGRVNYSKIGSMLTEFGKKGSGGGEFNLPWSVATDNKNGLLVVSDCNNHRVQVFDHKGDFLFKIGIQGSENGQFKHPKGVDISPNEYIIVADCNNHRIQIFNEDGKFIRKFGRQGNDPGDLNHPCGLACSLDNHVITTEQDTHRVQVFTIQGEPILHIGCQGFSKGQFIYPHHVTVGTKGEIMVSDCVNDRVQVFDRDGKYLFEFGKEGSQNGLFDGPEGVVTDDEGNILVCDYHNHRVQIFKPQGEFLATFGVFGEDEGLFKNPCGITFTSDGNIVVVDSGNNRVQIF